VNTSKNSDTLLPTLSVWVCCYNEARFISEAIESLLNQSYRPLEVIVTDDASTDNSVEIIQQFVKLDPIVSLIRNQKKMGIFYGTSKFLSIASGEYLFLHGADDVILPGFFEKSMRLLARYPDSGVCSSLTYDIDEKGRNKRLFVTPIVSTVECFIPPAKAILLANKLGNWMPGNAVIYKRTAFDTRDCLVPELGPAYDAFACKLIACKYGACFIPEALACRRVAHNSYSSRINRDANGMKKIWQNMEPLLTNYKEFFTKKHIENGRRIISYQINFVTLSDLQNKKADFIKKQMSPRKFLERMLFLLITLIAKIERFIYHLYAFVHSNRRIYPVMYNKLFMSLHFHILYFVSKMRKKIASKLYEN